MTLREQVAADLSTFTNVDEFGESVEFLDGAGEPIGIDGPMVTCVLEGNGDTEAPQDGVINRDTLMHVRVSELAEVPSVGQRVRLNDEPHDVIAVGEDQGMLEIRLRRYDS